MNEQTVWELLERLGAARRGHFQVGEQHADLALDAVEPMADPTAANTLAQALAAALPDLKPDLVLVWAGLPSVLMGFLVGIALDRPVVRLADDEGVVSASTPLQQGQRAALVGDVLTERQVRLARALVESRGASLATVAVLVDDGEPGQQVALASMKGRRFPSEACPLCQQKQPLQSLAGSPIAGAPNGQR